MTREEVEKLILEMKNNIEIAKDNINDWMSTECDFKRQLADLEKQLAEFDVEVYRGWIPKYMEVYYSIDEEGKIVDFYNDSEYDIRVKEHSPLGIFKTEEQAKKAYERHMAGEELKKLISEENAKQGWKVDWDNQNQRKYYLDNYDHRDGSIYTDWWSLNQAAENELYFSEKSASDQDFLLKITPLWLKWKGIE